MQFEKTVIGLCKAWYVPVFHRTIHCYRKNHFHSLDWLQTKFSYLMLSWVKHFFEIHPHFLLRIGKLLVFQHNSELFHYFCLWHSHRHLFGLIVCKFLFDHLMQHSEVEFDHPHLYKWLFLRKEFTKTHKKILFRSVRYLSQHKNMIGINWGKNKSQTWIVHNFFLIKNEIFLSRKSGIMTQSTEMTD